MAAAECSLKGAVHAFAVAHICLGAVFWYFLTILLDTLNHHRAALTMERRMLMGVQYFVYFFLFLPLGVVVHRGVRKESIPLLQPSALALALLQLYSIATQLQHHFLLSSLLAPHPYFYTELGLNAGVSGVYFVLILLYVRQLRDGFYLPPVYPREVEYFYYPQEGAECAVNYQNAAFVVVK